MSRIAWSWFLLETPPCQGSSTGGVRLLKQAAAVGSHWPWRTPEERVKPHESASSWKRVVCPERRPGCRMSRSFLESTMTSEPPKLPEHVRFGDGFELDARAYELRRAGRALKLERIPMEVLRLLVEEKGQLVSRDRIIERVWGRDVFLDTDNSINAAVRKIRQALKDDAEQPRFVQTVTGQGYRFIAAVQPADPQATEPLGVSDPAGESPAGKKPAQARL